MAKLKNQNFFLEIHFTILYNQIKAIKNVKTCPVLAGFKIKNCGESL